MKKKVILLITVFVGCILLLSSCGTPGAQDDSKAAAYLKAVGSDFEQSKNDLDVFDQDIGSEEDAAKLVSEIESSRSDFQKRLDNVKRQEVPAGIQGIVDFNSSLVEYYTDSIKMMNEMKEILNYSVEIYNSIAPLEDIMNMDMGDSSSLDEVLYAVDNMKSSVGESIDIAQKCSPPQYMVDCHANFIDALKSFNDATDDFVYALQLTDPLRINAAAYRYQLIANKLTYIGEDMNNEIEIEQNKMDELGQKLEENQQNLYEQLQNWRSQYKVAG